MNLILDCFIADHALGIQRGQNRHTGARIFSLLASNFDDHLRNHGFLMHEAGKWSLSPAYDINPVSKVDRVRVNKTAISEESREPSVEVALAVAGRFGLKPKQAKAILSEVIEAVSGWRKAGQNLRIKSATLNSYASAFENEFMQEAGLIIGNLSRL